MIDVKELRIRNYFKPLKESQDEFVEVVEIHSSGHVYCEDSAGIIFNSDEFELIPLTQEWLLKFGFYIKYDQYYSIECDNGYFQCLDFLFVGTGVQVFDDNSVKVVLLEYVHDLQNFFYSHNKKEPTLKTDNNDTGN